MNIVGDQVGALDRATLAELGALEPDRTALDGDRVTWFTDDGRYLEAHRYDHGWQIISEGRRLDGGGTGGFMGSCMSKGRVRQIAADLLAERSQRTLL